MKIIEKSHTLIRNIFRLILVGLLTFMIYACGEKGDLDCPVHGGISPDYGPPPACTC